MCNILHLRQSKIWLRPDWLFNITKYGKEQINLLDVIHGLTKKVNFSYCSLLCASLQNLHTFNSCTHYAFSYDDYFVDLVKVPETYRVRANNILYCGEVNTHLLLFQSPTGRLKSLLSSKWHLTLYIFALLCSRKQSFTDELPKNI